MPNWIRTTIDITGDREVLEKIYSAVNDCISRLQKNKAAETKKIIVK